MCWYSLVITGQVWPQFSVFSLFSSSSSQNPNWGLPTLGIVHTHIYTKYIDKEDGLVSIVTRHFFYKKTFMIKVIQNFMEITLCFNCFSEKTCWKMLFNILFLVSIFDTMFLFWFVGGCCLVAIAWSRIRLQMSTKKSQNLNLKNFFQQVLLEYVFI